MLTIKAEIKRGEQKNDGTYNVKLRFTLDRKVRRLSTSLFVKSEELTKTGQFKKNTKVCKEIEKLVTAYQEKCNAMQIDLNNYSLDYIFKLLRFEEQKERQIDFIGFSRRWIANAPIKSKETYDTVIKSLTSFIGRDSLYTSEITVSFLAKYKAFLEKRRDERNKKLTETGKRIPSNRTVSLYLGCIRHLFKEAQREYNDMEDNLMLIPSSPFDNFKIPRQEATRKRAIDKSLLRKIYALPYKNKVKGSKGTCRFDLAKDCFIMSFCLIGMNSVDLYNAKEFVDGKIIYNRAKTKGRRLDQARMEVVVPPMILPLLEKYRDKTAQRLFNFYHYYSDGSSLWLYSISSKSSHWEEEAYSPCEHLVSPFLYFCLSFRSFSAVLTLFSLLALSTLMSASALAFIISILHSFFACVSSILCLCLSSSRDIRRIAENASLVKSPTISTLK